MALRSIARRQFLQGAACVAATSSLPAIRPSPAWLVQARELVRRGILGQVVYCRAAQAGASGLAFILGRPAPLYDPNGSDGAIVICGRDRTLVASRRGVYVYGPSSPGGDA